MEARTKRWLMGCGLGCGALLLLGIGSCVGFAVWINTPGDVLDPGQLVGTDTIGYLEWTLRLEDPGTRDVVDRLLQALQETRRDAPTPLPSFLGDRLNEYQDRKNERSIQKLFPIVLVWTLRPGETEDTDLHLLSASLRGLDHQLVLADWIMGSFLGRARDVDVVRHRSEKIYVLHSDDDADPVVVFLRDGDVFFATSVDAARAAIDRLAAPTPVAAPGPVDEWLRRTPERPLRGALSNARGELRRIWVEYLDEDVDGLLSETAWDAIRAVTLEGRFAGTTLEVVADVHMTSSEAAARAEPALAEAVEHALDGTAFEFRSSAVNGSRVSLLLEITTEVKSLGSVLDDDPHDGDGRDEGAR